jgi:hypothetical protein
MMSKKVTNPSLTASDAHLIREIDRNFTFMESVMGLEPLIWYSFDVLPPVDQPYQSKNDEVNLARKKVFSRSLKSNIRKP